jgi:hypothetical protein
MWVPTVSSSDGSVTSDGCSRSQTRTWTAIDFCGNTSTASRTVNWIVDLTPPVLTTGGTGTSLGCNPSAGDINGALGTVTATDACGVPTVSQSDGYVSSNGCSRSQTRKFTARDFCGNTSTASRTVTWTADLTPPVLTTGGTGTSLGCNPSAGDINGALGTATATDACGVPTVSSSDGSVTSDGCSRSQTRTWTAIDFCGNTSTASRTVTWTTDLTPPVLTTGGTGTSLGCNPSAGDINGALGTATATDACGVPTVSSSDGSVTSDGCSRSQTRTWTARDFCGNTSTASRTVNWIVDLTPPVLTTGGTGTSLGCNPSAGDINGALGTATATDACGVPTVSQSDGYVSGNGCSRSQTRKFTARDFCGNTSTASRTVTWTADLTPPVLTTGGTGTSLGCNPSAGDINGALGTATATDACGTPTVSSSDGSVSSNGCSRSQTRTWTAIDFCGNTSTASRTVTWTADLTPPVLTTGGTGTSVGCNPIAGDINGALGTATATDACGVPTVSQSDGSVSSNGCSRSQTRTWTARDFCGNTSTASRTVTWAVDNASPSLQTINTSLWPPNHKMVDFGLTASDNCGITSAYITVTSNEPKNDIGDGDTEVDIAFNGGVEDPNAATYTVKGPVTIGSDGKVHIQLRAERSGVNALAPEEGRIYTITFVATDGCNNSTTSTSTVNVAHNITSPNVGNSFKIGTTVSLAGTFWDVPGNTHTAKWMIDAATVNGTIVSEPSGNKMGKVSGSYKPTAAGIYKLRMNVTDQKGVTSYATTNGDYEAFLVCYDPNGGYTYGGGKFISPDNAAISNPGMTGQVAFGFASNYFKNATNPKGETELVFKDGGVEFNAVNYDVLVVDPTKSKATYKGLGKTIINGVEQSGYAFLMTVIDGKTPTNLNGTDRIRIKIYNKNTGAIIYDNQPLAPEDADPIVPVDNPMPDGCDIVVVNTPPAPSADITRSAQMEVLPEIAPFNVRVFPNPSQDQFSLYLENANNDKVHIVVYDALGREVKKFEKEGGNIPVIFGRDLKGGAYFVEVRQGENRKTVKLVKQN